MEQTLYKFLVLNGHLCIPQLGSFIVKHEPARIDVASGILHPPKPLISFTEGEIPMSEKLFYDFLSNELGVDEVAAIRQFHEYAEHFRNELEEKRKVFSPGLGIIYRLQDGSLKFEPATDLSNLLPALPIEESLIYEEADTELEQSKPDYWWFYAIILLILGVGALVYYYI